MADAVTWRLAVEDAIEDHVPERAAEVLAAAESDGSWLDALDNALDLEGADLEVAVREAVDVWLEAHDTYDMSGEDCEGHLISLLGGLTDEQVNELADMAEEMHAEGDH